ncbi:MAG: hypothetical protein HWN66_00300 [Candidatus Helarchaeota archaeon]|nr:hypothetical protein [Candidatus Helarchaeota archaeon]
MDVMISNDQLKTDKYPPWLYFFPFYVMLFSYALLGRTGFIIVADVFEPPLPSSEFVLYYILTYCVFFPIIFISQWVYYRTLSKRYGVFWQEFSPIDKSLILTYAILGILFYLWVEWIFGVNAPYDSTWDFSIGWMHVYWGDFVGFFIAIPLLMIGFHGINYAICHRKGDRRRHQFFLVVVGTSVIGTITQDWFWWISAPSNPWGPGTTIYFYFTGWIHIPFTPIYIPVIYLIVAIISLAILYLATIRVYSFKQYLFWCVSPYLLLVFVGNILSFIF